MMNVLSVVLLLVSSFSPNPVNRHHEKIRQCQTSRPAMVGDTIQYVWWNGWQTTKVTNEASLYPNGDVIDSRDWEWRLVRHGKYRILEDKR